MSATLTGHTCEPSTTSVPTLLTTTSAPSLLAAALVMLTVLNAKIPSTMVGQAMSYKEMLDEVCPGIGIADGSL